MKKVILCLLLLIPILVVLTIQASGKLIASALVDIPAESMVIKHAGEVLESGEIYLEEYKDTDKKYTVFCEFFPGIATDEILWESSNPRVATVTPDPDREDAANIKFIDYGSVDITCVSKKNSSISARATLYVGGLIPGYMSIGNYADDEITELILPRYAVKGLVANVKPARSVKEEKVYWTIADESVASVDQNGIITAKKHGETTVTATVSAKGTSVSAEVTVRVEGDALSREAFVYASGSSVNLALYKTSGEVTVEGGEEVDLSAIAEFSAREVTFRKGEETQTVYVVRVPAQKALVIENYHVLKEGALSGFVALGTSNIRLSALATDGSDPEVSWQSSDEDVIVFRGNRLYAVGSGQAEIYPAAEGYAAQHITLNVTSPVEDFRLAETSFRDEVGLLQERVFGNTTYKDGQYTNTYTFKIASTYPLGASLSAFSFESGDTSVATVDQNGVISFASDVEGKEVEIIAIAYNQQGMPVRRTYTFHLVNGVNIGVDIPEQHFDASAGEKPNFTPYTELQAVASNREVKAIVLHSDVYFLPLAEGGHAVKNLSASIYGNGKKLDGQYLISSNEERDKLLLWDFETYLDMPEALEVKIINLNMQATQPTSDDAQKAFEELSAKGGGSIGVLGAYPKASNHFSLYVKGCLFQYAYGHTNTAIGDVEYDGCIFRNNSASAIVLQQSSYGVANATVKNCIFSNTIAPVGIACGNFDDVLARFGGGKKDLHPQYGSFNLEGTNYIYNWKRLGDVQMSLLPRGLESDDANLLVDQVNAKLGTIIKEAFDMSDLENLYVEDVDAFNALTKQIDQMEYLEKHSYLNFSFLMIGLWDNMNPIFNPETFTPEGLNVNYDPANYMAVRVNAEAAPSVSSLLGVAKLLNIDVAENETYHIVCRDQKGNFNTQPGETYTIGPEVYARLRGETTVAADAE